MLYNFILSLMFFISSSIISAEKEIIPSFHSIISLKKGKIAGIGSNDCIVFDENTCPIHHIKTKKNIYGGATNKDKSLLALSIHFDDPIIYDTATNTEHTIPNILHTHNMPVDYNAKINAFVFAAKETLYFYNISNNRLTSLYIPEFSWCNPYISYNSIEDKFIYSPDYQKLTTIRFFPTSLIKEHFITDFPCDLVTYAPDGKTIAILSHGRQQSNYFVCNLKDNQEPLPAYQLTNCSKNYEASVFHPKLPLLGLLTEGCLVHIFNYITKKLVASKKFTRNIVYTSVKKGIDFDETGRNILTVFGNTCEVPQQNFATICNALHTLLPTEIVDIIIKNILQKLDIMYDYIDYKELWKKPIQQNTLLPQKPNQSRPSRPQLKKIKAVYKKQF